MEYYIKKNDVVSMLMKEAKSHGLSFSAEAYERAANLTACMPNEEVQPVKHGRWDFQGYQLFKCTNCNEMFTQNQLEAMQNHKDCEECAFPNYCPNCGADMRGDENE